MLEDYENLIRGVLRNVPAHLRDDCYQAACVGLVKALKRDNALNQRAYIYGCMRSEVLDEIARLNYPISLNKETFLKLCKYKKSKNPNENIDISDIVEKRRKKFDMLLGMNKISYQVMGK